MKTHLIAIRFAAAALAFCLALPPSVLALRVSAPGEDPDRLSGLEESMIVGATADEISEWRTLNDQQRFIAQWMYETAASLRLDGHQVLLPGATHFVRHYLSMLGPEERHQALLIVGGSAPSEDAMQALQEMPWEAIPREGPGRAAYERYVDLMNDLRKRRWEEIDRNRRMEADDFGPVSAAIVGWGLSAEFDYPQSFEGRESELARIGAAFAGFEQKAQRALSGPASRHVAEDLALLQEKIQSRVLEALQTESNQRSADRVLADLAFDLRNREEYRALALVQGLRLNLRHLLFPERHPVVIFADDLPFSEALALVQTGRIAAFVVRRSRHLSQTARFASELHIPVVAELKSEIPYYLRYKGSLMLLDPVSRRLTSSPSPGEIRLAQSPEQAAGLEEGNILAHETGLSFRQVRRLMKKHRPTVIHVTQKEGITRGAFLADGSLAAARFGRLEGGWWGSLGRRYSITVSQGVVASLSQSIDLRVKPSDIVAHITVLPSATGLEEIKDEVREVLDGLSGPTPESASVAAAVAKIRIRMVDPLKQSQEELAERSRPAIPDDLSEKMEQVRKTVRLAEEAFESIQQSFSWAEELFAQANARNINLSSHERINEVLVEWLRQAPLSTGIILVLSRQYVAYQYVLEAHNRAARSSGLDQVLEERGTAIQELADKAREFASGFPAFQRKWVGVIELFQKNDRIGKSNSGGLEEAVLEGQVGVVAAAIADPRGLALGVAVSRLKDSNGRAVPLVYIAQSVEEATGLEELGADSDAIFVLGPDLSLEAALTAAEDWLRLTAGVRRAVRLGVDQKIPGVLEWLIQQLPGIILSPQMATGLEEWVEGATKLLEAA